MEGIKIGDIGKAHEKLGVNVDSAVEFVRKHEGIELSDEDLERAQEIIGELREFQIDIDVPEVREAIAQLVNLVSKNEQRTTENEPEVDPDIEKDPEKLKKVIEAMMENPQ